jgi:hypothetical protein
MIMNCKRIALLAATLCVATSALADNAAPDSAGGRYVFSKQADGFVRLDTQSGEVSLCSPKPVGWACEAAPEDRVALENEIDRLRADNAALKKAILSRGLPLPAGIMPEPLAQNNDFTVHLPSDANIDRMAAYVGQVWGDVWHRFVDAVERAQKQVLNKS